jgi:hypothetical protein
MKKALIIFYLSYFILGHADIIVGGDVPRPFGVFSELIATVSEYKNLPEALDNKNIIESIDTLLERLKEFYRFHKKSLPSGSTTDVHQPFHTFNALISSSVTDYIKEIDRTKEIKSKDFYADLINKNFISTIINILTLRPILGSDNIYEPSELPPTHLYALIRFYRENHEFINDTLDPETSEVVKFLLNESATQSLDLFQSFLEESFPFSADTFEEYAQLHKLNGIDYDNQLLKAFAPAEKMESYLRKNSLPRSKTVKNPIIQFGNFLKSLLPR